MKEYNVEMAYGTCITVNVTAESEEDAISKAKRIVDMEVDIREGFNADTNGLNFESVNTVIEK